jgi:hypothetical protein
MKNKATFLIYWFCASREGLLDSVLKGDKKSLVALGIPEEYIVKDALNTVKKEEPVFRLFYRLVIKRCYPKPCTRYSIGKLIDEVIKRVFHKS